MARDYTHRNLILWQRAQELAYEVSLIVQRMPQSWTNAVIARQIIAAATSVGANIAEGHGRYTPRAHRNHLYIARGSLAETDSWLDQLRRMGFLTVDQETPLLQKCGQINAMLTHKILAMDARVEQGSDTLLEASVTYTVAFQQSPPFGFNEADYR